MYERPKDERPRERLQKDSADSLTDIELVEILIGSGNKDRGVESIASETLLLLDKTNGLASYRELLNIKGLGEAKASLIKAAMELARRKFYPATYAIDTPLDAYRLVAHMADRPEENFLCITLNGAQEVIKTRLISTGIVNRAIVHPREVFAKAVSDRATAVVLAHNHPSGNVMPSEEDRDVTHRLMRAGALLGIPVLDHLVFSPKGYYSFLENGDMEWSKANA